MKKLLLTAIISLTAVLYAQTLKYDYIVMGTKSGKYIETTETINKKDQCIFRLTTKSEIKIGRGDRSLTLETETVSNSECKTFKPIDFYSKSQQGKSITIQKGHSENGKFIVSVKNSSGEASKAIELPENVIFFGNIFYKYGFKDKIPDEMDILSEESLAVTKLLTNSKIVEKNKIVEMKYNSIPISATVNDKGIPVISSIKNGLIISVLEGTDIKEKFKAEANGDIISKSSIINSGIKIKYPRKASETKFEVSGSEKNGIISLPYQKTAETVNKQFVTSYITASDKTELKNPEQFIKTNIYENSDYPPIKEEAKKWEIFSPAEKVKKAVNFVYRHISNKNYANGQLSASEAYDRKEGDCTEHAALLAALLKASGIPVRMIYGLILMPDNKFYYHNWNDVFINGNWQPVDSAFNMEKADSARIALIVGENSSFEREKIGTSIIKFVGSVEISVKESK